MDVVPCAELQLEDLGVCLEGNPFPLPPEVILNCSASECTKIAHRRSLAIFTADEGIATNSAARMIFTRLHRRRSRGSLAIFFAEEIAHLGASKRRAIFPGAAKIAAATAENRAILVHSALHAHPYPRRGYVEFHHPLASLNWAPLTKPSRRGSLLNPAARV